MKKSSRQSGFTLIELLVAAALGIVVLTAATMMFKKAAQAAEFMSARIALQQNIRAAINSIATDISVAGTGLPYGGVPLPDTTGNNAPVFACDGVNCYVTQNTFLNNHLYAVMPGFQKGVAIGPNTTSIVTVSYVDYSLALNQYSLTNVTPSGNQITVDNRTAITDPAVGIKNGDLIMVYNANGSAIGTVTNVAANNKINFANSDPLNMNQPSAAHGNIASILAPVGGGGGAAPPTSAVRIMLVTYFLALNPGPDGNTGTADDGPNRLMRQVNALPPVPIAENITNVQFSFDIFDESASSTLTDLNDANNLPNQIRKVNIAISATSGPVNQLTHIQQLTLATSVSPRNLSFRDRYQ
jgi:prepilin-type N-terminal cleavage/methylation domain-containing protein